jgi:hypothetical protein
MSIETAKYDIVYGRLLSLGIEINKAKVMAKILLDISNKINLSMEDLLKNISKSGLKFDNDVYHQLNNARTNSSQLGYLDKTNIPASVLQQVV